MWNITVSGNTIQFSNGEKVWGFPKNTIWLHANPDDESSIDVKLGASRKLMISFNHKDCNLAGQTPFDTINNILGIL